METDAGDTSLTSMRAMSNELPQDIDSPRGPQVRGSLQPDIERYREHIKRMNLSDAQATQLINALWKIMSAFVDKGFGVDSAQLALSRPKATTSKPATTSQTKPDGETENLT